MDKQLTFAVVGAAHGHIERMAQGLTEAGARLSYVYDPDPLLTKKLAAKFPRAKIAASEQEILADERVDLIACAAVPSERAPIAIRALTAGKDFFTAKAPYISSAQAEQVRAAIERNRRKYFVFYSEYFDSEAALYAERLIREGKIGRVVNVTILAPHKLGNGRPDWFYRKEKTGGILIDIGSHQFEQFLRFTGNETAEIVSASVANFAHKDTPAFEDFADCRLRGANGATGYIRVDWFTPEHFPVFGDGKVVILGTDGYLELRKYIDVGGDGEEVVVCATGDKVYKRALKGAVEKPFFAAIVDDCLRRTDTAGQLDRGMAAMRLAIEAETRAEKIE